MLITLFNIVLIHGTTLTLLFFELLERVMESSKYLNSPKCYKQSLQSFILDH